MQFHFFSPLHFEPWDWRNPDTVGIGGSETSHVEMARRLAQRGYRVTSYSPLPADTRSIHHQDVFWCDLKDARWDSPGIWCLYRCPKDIDHFWPRRNNQQLWLICQDEDYGADWTPGRLDRIDKVVALCQAQKNQIEARYPDLRGKVVLSSNGLKGEMVDEVLAEGHQRHPKRLLYPSSPDRGLANLLRIFERVREYDEEFELWVAYGFDNIDHSIVQIQAIAEAERHTSDKAWLTWILSIKEALKGPGIKHFGRLPQRELYRLWAQCGLWCYPTTFRETSCISSMEAQALGAVPIVSPVWAVAENVRYGVTIPGNCREPGVWTRFAAEVVKMGQDAKSQETLRHHGMPLARQDFHWERWVDQWDGWAQELEARQESAREARHALPQSV